MAQFSERARDGAYHITIPYLKPGEGIYPFLTSEDFAGEFYYVWRFSVTEGPRGKDFLDCSFTDADTALAFKMRWC